MNLAADTRKQIPLPIVAASGRFNGFRPEEEKTVRPPAQLIPNPRLGALFEAWEKIGTFCMLGNFDDGYSTIRRDIKHLRCSSGDIEAFSLRMTALQHQERFRTKAGLFLSALINNCTEKEITVHTSDLSRGIYLLGFRNSRNVTVDGDVGEYAGDSMLGGSMLIQGKADLFLGHGMSGGRMIVRQDSNGKVGSSMRGGEIIAHGSVQTDIGDDMIGGRIHVIGDVLGRAGSLMEGGEILVDGGLGEIASDARKGRIFHNGIAVFDKPGLGQVIRDIIAKSGCGSE